MKTKKKLKNSLALSRSIIIFLSIGCIWFGWYWIREGRQGLYSQALKQISQGNLKGALFKCKLPVFLMPGRGQQLVPMLESTIEGNPKHIADAIFSYSAEGKALDYATAEWSKIINGLAEKESTPQGRIDLLILASDVKLELHHLYADAEGVDSYFQFAKKLRDNNEEALETLLLMNSAPNKKILVCYEIDESFEISYYDSVYLPKKYLPEKIGDTEFIILVETTRKTTTDDNGTEYSYFSTPKISLKRLSDNVKIKEFDFELQIGDLDKSYWKPVPNRELNESVLVNIVDSYVSDFWRLAVGDQSIPSIKGLMPQITSILEGQDF